MTENVVIKKCIFKVTDAYEICEIFSINFKDEMSEINGHQQA
jgi:hypothetical protein